MRLFNAVLAAAVVTALPAAPAGAQKVAGNHYSNAMMELV